MALSRNARRRLNKNKAKARALRKLARSEAIRQDAIATIVKRNTRNGAKRNYYKGTTFNYEGGGAASVSPQKHCEAKQRVTVYGKEHNLTGRRIANGKFDNSQLASKRG